MLQASVCASNFDIEVTIQDTFGYLAVSHNGDKVAELQYVRETDAAHVTLHSVTAQGYDEWVNHEHPLSDWNAALRQFRYHVLKSLSERAS